MIRLIRLFRFCVWLRLKVIWLVGTLCNELRQATEESRYMGEMICARHSTSRVLFVCGSVWLARRRTMDSISLGVPIWLVVVWFRWIGEQVNFLHVTVWARLSLQMNSFGWCLVGGPFPLISLIDSFKSFLCSLKLFKWSKWSEWFFERLPSADQNPRLFTHCVPFSSSISICDHSTADSMPTSLQISSASSIVKLESGSEQSTLWLWPEIFRIISRSSISTGRREGFSLKLLEAEEKLGRFWKDALESFQKEGVQDVNWFTMALGCLLGCYWDVIRMRLLECSLGWVIIPLRENA